MAANLNQCNFIGRVGKSPDIRRTASGTCCANFSLAVDKRFKAQSGEWETRTEWIPVVFMGKVAEVIETYVDKGALLFVSGEFQTRKWEDKEKNTRYSTEIFGDKMQMLGGKGEGGNKGQGGGGQQNAQGYDDIPDFGEVPF